MWTNRIVRNHAKEEHRDVSQGNPAVVTAIEPGLDGNQFKLRSWLASVILIFVLLYRSSYLALLWLPPYKGVDMRSQLTVDYSAWAFLVFQPVDSAVIEEIRQERGLPEQLIVDGFFWPTPTSTLSVPPTASSTPTSTPPTTFDTLSASPMANTSTPMPTSIISLPGLTVTPQPTRTSIPATSTSFATATKTPIYYPATPTSTSMPGATSTSTVIASTVTPTLTSTGTATSTTAPAHTFIPTATIASTFTPTPTDTATVTPTYTFTPAATLVSTSTPTPTDTPTVTPTATPTPTFTPTPDPIEPDFAGPDGNTTILGNGMSVEFSLSGFLLDGNSTWDVIFYEKEEATSSDKIHLGAVRIEVYDDTTSTWYTIYNWGDGIADTNASYNNSNSEPDGFPVDKTLLQGVPPLNTGIAIDIDAPAIGQGGAIGDSINRIRITSLSSAKCEVDALQMLR